MADCSFPKNSRLLAAEDFKAVFDNTQFKVSCRHFLVLAIDNDGLNSRLGMVVAKKHVSTAVQRNRIKRQIRQLFRHNAELLSGLDLVVLARKDADTLDNKQLSEKMGILWKDLHSKRTSQQ